MSKKELLISEIDKVPEPFLDEVLDFVYFLKTKIIKGRLAKLRGSGLYF